jgi:hypothetical protein
MCWLLLTPLAIVLGTALWKLVRAIIEDNKMQRRPGPATDYYDFEVFERYW